MQPFTAGCDAPGNFRKTSSKRIALTGFPRHCQQIVRSADSVGANLAEGTGRGTYPENRRFVKIDRGSLNETQHWLRCAYIGNLLTVEQVDKLKPIIDELAPKLNSYLKSIGSISEDKKQLTTDH